MKKFIVLMMSALMLGGMWSNYVFADDPFVYDDIDGKYMSNKQVELQKNLDDAKDDAATKSATESLEKFQKSIQYKKWQLKIRYQELKNANDEKGRQLSAPITGPTREKGIDTKTLELRSAANKDYGKFLDAKTAYELCVLTKEGEDLNCSDYLQNMRSAGQKVREVLAQLTKLEQETNQQMTFDVSKIFSLDPKTAEKKSVETVVNRVADWMIRIVVTLAVTTMIIGGFMMVISGGAETRLETGKTIFTYSLIGVVVVLMAYGVISLIQSLFY